MVDFDITSPQPMRQHPRVHADFVVKLGRGAHSVLARALDVSLAGVALHDPAGEVDGQVDRVSLKIPGEDGELQIPVKFARRSGDRVALAFSDLDWDDLFALARYLSPRL